MPELKRRGWTLMELVGSFFVSAVLLGVCVPLFFAAEREAEIGMQRARLTEQARWIAARFREDVRRAAVVRVAPDGRELLLTLGRTGSSGTPERIRYRDGEEGLVREVLPGGVPASRERTVCAPPVVRARFDREGRGVVARFRVARTVRSRPLRVEIAVRATPRVEP